MATYPEQVGERIRRERERAGLSLAQFANLTGLSKTYLVRLETQRANPSIAVLGRIAEALDLTVADLVGSARVELDDSELPVPPSLRAFLDEEGLGTQAMRTLASIRFRKGEEPRSVDRWRYIWNSLELSRSLDRNDRHS